MTTASLGESVHTLKETGSAKLWHTPYSRIDRSTSVNLPWIASISSVDMVSTTLVRTMILNPPAFPFSNNYKRLAGKFAVCFSIDLLIFFLYIDCALRLENMCIAFVCVLYPPKYAPFPLKTATNYTNFNVYVKGKTYILKEASFGVYKSSILYTYMYGF